MNLTHPLYEYGLIIGLIGLIIFFFNPFFKVAQETVYVIERFGKFLRPTKTGLNFKIPFIDTLKGPLSYRIEHSSLVTEAKTNDDVFLNITILLQYRLNPDKVCDAFYHLNDSQTYVANLVSNFIKSFVITFSMDDVYKDKDKLGLLLKNTLESELKIMGLSLLNVYIINIQPDAKIKNAMLEIAEAQRISQAVQLKESTDILRKHKGLELEVENKLLQGKGIANQWQEMLGQLEKSLENIQKIYPNMDPDSIIKMLMRFYYLDIVRDATMQRKEQQQTAMDVAANPIDKSQLMREAVIGGLTGATKDMLEKVLPGSDGK